MTTPTGIARLLRRIVGARGGLATVILVLPNEQEIACRDKWQATVIAELWAMLRGAG